MKIKNIFYNLVIVVAINNCLYSQPFVDTLYSGRNTEIDLTKSISSQLEVKLQNVQFYKSNAISKLEWKSIVPSVLRYNSIKRIKSNSILNYDALIYTIYSKHNSVVHETIFMEMFFESEKLAKECITGLKKLEQAFDIYKNSDVVESKTAMVGQLEHYNCYFKRKGKVVYFIYNMIPDTKENPLTAIMKEKLYEIID